MARYNKFNHGIKYNQKPEDEGGIFNYIILGNIGIVASKLVMTASSHLRKSVSSVVGITASLSGGAKRAIHRAVNIVLSSSAAAKGIRERRTTGGSNITATLSGTAKRNRPIKAVTEIVLNLIARLRQKYRPVYPELSVTEYIVNTALTEYGILLEVSGMPFVGSTITLRGTFPDSAGDLTQLDDVVCNVYFPDRTLAETIVPTELSTGVYSADYTIPEGKEGKYDYEFLGTLGDRTIVGRSSFDSLWKY